VRTISTALSSSNVVPVGDSVGLGCSTVSMSAALWQLMIENTIETKNAQLMIILPIINFLMFLQ
jgi:hypothetical protein